jgi:hypothetical protein
VGANYRVPECCSRRDMRLRQLNVTFHPVGALIKGLSHLMIIVARSAIEISKVTSTVRKKSLHCFKKALEFFMKAIP